MRPDRFEFTLESGDWLFTLALSLATGLILAGGLAVWRSRTNPVPAVILVVAGLALGLATGLSVLDASPYHPIDFRLKPYFGTIALAAAVVVTVVAGVSAVLVLGVLTGTFSRRPRPAIRALVVAGTTVVAAAWVLSRLGAEVEAFRHPEATVTSATVPSTLVIDGLELPTGLAIASDGTIAVTQLMQPVLTLFTPGSDGRGFERLEIPLPVAEGAQVFHVVLHPGYPEVPYAYVSAEEAKDGGSSLQVMRVRLDTAGETTPVVEGLPIEQARFSNHSGSAMAICGEYFYLSTGDTDPYADASRSEQRSSIRVRAQVPGAPEGKILRYRLSGVDLEPAGVIANEPPVFAMGFRNVFGMGCDVETGNPIAADNGPTALDQIRLVAPGSNHEWPLTETRDTIEPPLFSTGRTVIAPTGVASRELPAGVEAIVSAYESRALYLLPYSDGTAIGPLRLLTEVEGGAYAVAIDSKGCVLYSGPTAVWRLDEPACTP